MRKFCILLLEKFIPVLLLQFILYSFAGAQQTTMKDYVIFGGKSGTANGGVTLSSSTTVYGGSVGSYQMITTTGNSNFSSNLFSGGNINLANGNSVTGRITAANTTTAAKAINIGSNAALVGNIDANGNISVASGTVSAQVTHPAGTLYTGPTPAGGDITGPPSLPGLPQMAPIEIFPNPVNGNDVTSNANLYPGTYGDIVLSGNKTINFKRAGKYIFNKIANSGGATNELIFDFENKAEGNYIICIIGDADLGKVKVSSINGGGAARIFTEVHGNGATNGGVAFSIANGSSSNAITKWLGTVWVPYAGISIGSGTGNSNISGALWSGTSVSIQSGVNVEYVPYSDCVPPNVDAGPDKPLSFSNETVLTATSTTPGTNFTWKALNGGLIVSGNTGAEIKINASGTYVVTASGIKPDCTATDTINVSAKLKSLIGSELQSVYDNYIAGTGSSTSPFFLIQSDKIYIDVITLENQYSNVLSLLTGPAYGLTNILSNGTSQYIITGLFPISKLPLLNNLQNLIVYVRPYYPAISKSGIVTSAGDVAMRSDLVRKGYGLQGQGVKVGVISNSYSTITSATSNPITNTAAQDVINGDLPGIGNPEGNVTPVHVLKEFPFASTDEGRAMLQIVHDVAPKAELYFRTGTISAGDFANGIIDLKNAGCNVIVDDVTFITEPFLKDGVIASAVDQVTAAGTTYFSAAGNFANKSYENVFKPVAAPAGVAIAAHDFGGGDRFQNITLSPGNYTIVLQWLDDIYSLGQTSAGGTKNDLDIYLTPDTDGSALFGFNRNNTNGDPIEVLPFTLNTTVNTNVLITNNTPGSNPARFKYVIFRGDVVFNEYATGTSTIVGQANAQGAIAIGAVRFDKVAPYAGPLVIESFSSQGGTVVNGAVRNKPDFVSVDGVNTTVNLGADYPAGTDNYSNFFGTSAAAPHAAAVAALIMEGKSKFSGVANTTPAAVKSVMQSAATDMYTPGFDLLSGYGFINADASLRTFAQPTPTLVELKIPGNVSAGQVPFTLTLSGINFSSTSVVYFRNAIVPATFVNTTTLTAQVPVFIGNPEIKVFTPPVSSSMLDGGFSNALRLLAIPKKAITIIPDAQNKKYAQDPAILTATVLVDGDSLQHTIYTLADLGLASMTLSSVVTSSSNVGSYIINATRVFDPQNSTDVGYQELYNYTFQQGTYTVGKLAVKIKAQNVQVHYGQKIPNTRFTYEFDPTGISNAAAFLNSLQTDHSSQVARDLSGADIIGLVNGQAVTIVNGQAIPIVNGQAVTIVNGQAVAIVNGQAVPIVNSQAITIVNGQAVTIVNNLTASQVDGINFLATTPTISGSRVVTNNTLVNGVYQQGTTQVVDITQESILKFNVNSAQTSMLSAVPIVNGVDFRGIVDVGTYKDGQAITIVNGQAVTIVNGQALTIVNGQAVSIVNGQAVTIVNGQAVPIVNSQGKTAVIVSQSEIGQGLSQLKSLNLITGLAAGSQFIIPAAYVNGNLDLTYVAAVADIAPAVVTITPNAGQNKEFGNVDPAFMFSNNANLPASTFTGKLGRQPGETVGIYNFTIGTLTAGSDYVLQLANTNTFSITPKQVVVTPLAGQYKIYGDADPVFSYTTNPLLSNGSLSGALSRVQGENANTYSYTPGSLTGGSNYLLTIAATADKFTIQTAPLVVKAIDNYTYEGVSPPPFTFQVNTFKNGDANPGVSYTLSPNYTGNSGVYSIRPVLNSFANSGNYNISYVNGTFYVNPNDKKSRKLRAYLDCVEEIQNPPAGGFKYVAHFYCINDNRTTIYIPVGPDNKITSIGSFDNSQQAFAFTPGITQFNVLFDGNALTWELSSYESTNKSSTTSSASAGSNKCSLTPTFTGNPLIQKAGAADDIKETSGDKAMVYPNPVLNKARLTVSDEIINVKALKLVDVYGRLKQVKVVGSIGKNAVDIDMTALPSGVYFLQVSMKNGIKTISVVKK